MKSESKNLVCELTRRMRADNCISMDGWELYWNHRVSVSFSVLCCCCCRFSDRRVNPNEVRAVRQELCPPEWVFVFVFCFLSFSLNVGGK